MLSCPCYILCAHAAGCYYEFILFLYYIATIRSRRAEYIKTKTFRICGSAGTNKQPVGRVAK